MAPKQFAPVFKPAQEKINHGVDLISVSRSQQPINLTIANCLKFFVKDAFKLSTLALFGSVAQVALFSILPFRWAVVPPVLLSLNAIITTIIQTLNPKSNPYMAPMVPGRVSAQIPARDTGRSGPAPAEDQVIVFHLGVQYNHPLGLLAPGAAEVGSRFTAMNDDLKKRADEYGLLHVSTWRGSERGSNNTLMLVYYFRDLASLNKFAFDPLHMDTWNWFNKIKRQYPHLGILHEAFVSAPKSYENVYVNCNPILLGQASVKCETEEGEAWVNPLVNADVPQLKSQHSRMGRE
jgi:fumagillin biosynthesis monooxygenase